MSDYSNLPSFDKLPKVEDMPQGCAWGIFDKDGKKDHLGCLNLLTPSVVQAALKEATQGVSVSLNWPIGAIKTPGFGRKGLDHKILDFMNTSFQIHGFDDEVAFNTQCSSQWDSLCHFAYQPTGHYYNGVSPTVAQLIQDFGSIDSEKAFPTLNHWHEVGGMVGRGVLIDYRAYTEAKGIKYSPFETHAITTKAIEEVAEWEGLIFKQGDIIIVRSGFTEELGRASAEEQEKLLGSHQAAGVEGTPESAAWFWNKHFSAVAGDTIAFEVLPPQINAISDLDDFETRPNTSSSIVSSASRKGDSQPLAVLHQYFISLFGLCIGELWDLKALSVECAKQKKYSFLLTSVPLNVPGGVGSPPNALAIF